MKQRFISFLLSAVMLLTMLPVTAFAADADAPEIEVYFYADGNKADKEAGSLFRNSKAMLDDDKKYTKGNGANTLVVFCKGLEPEITYNLMLQYPQDAISNKSKFQKFTDEQGNEIYLRKLAELKNTSSKKIDRLMCFDLKVSGIDFSKCEAEHIVSLYDSSNISNNTLVGTSMSTDEFTLKKIQIDFGTDAILDQIIDVTADKSNNYYTENKYPTVTTKKDYPKTVAEFLVDTVELEKLNNPDNHDICTYFDKIFRFTSDAERLYNNTKNKLKRWFQEDDSTFVWRTQLYDVDIDVAELFDTREGQEHVERLYKEGTYHAIAQGIKAEDGVLDAENANDVEISAEELVKHWSKIDNINSLGGWVGFKIDTPENATSVRYKTASTSGDIGDPYTSASNWKTATLEKNENGEVIGQHSFYTNALVDNSSTPDPAYCAIQYYDADGIPVTMPYTFKLDTQGVNSTKAVIVSSVLMNNNVTSAIIPDEFLINLGNSPDENGVVVIDSSEIVDYPDPTGLIITTSSVQISKTALDAVKNRALEIRTPIGAIEIPADKLPVNANTNNLQLIMNRISRDDILETANFGENADFYGATMDTLEVTVKVDGNPQTIDLGNTEVDLTLKLNQVVVPDDPAATVYETTLDLLSFERNIRGGTPRVETRCVDEEYSKTRNEVTFKVKDLSRYYSVMQRFYVDKMHTDDDRFIKVNTPGFQFSKTKYSYEIETTSDSVEIETSKAARRVNGGNISLIDYDKLKWTQDVKETTTVKIKIGVDTYTLTIKRKIRPEGDWLTLTHDFDTIPGMDKITVGNIREGRMYYAQVRKTEGTNRTYYYYVVKATSKDSVVFYVPAFYAGYSTKIEFFVWEISQGATEPFYANASGEPVINHVEGLDRRIERLVTIARPSN